MPVVQLALGTILVVKERHWRSDVENDCRMYLTLTPHLQFPVKLIQVLILVPSYIRPSLTALLHHVLFAGIIFSGCSTCVLDCLFFRGPFPCIHTRIPYQHN